ncbi:hypothetical protein NPIL_300511 [Nephila pilipes]|uniref:Uncharacterized protein n=1 Tax=Nephila pilipes TaxID=299642 RepID=A0A8X6QSM6_NEPPI|nr:hypothetical protein NPIL_300511 [Nephila pilipes]
MVNPPPPFLPKGISFPGAGLMSSPNQGGGRVLESSLITLPRRLQLKEKGNKDKNEISFRDYRRVSVSKKHQNSAPSERETKEKKEKPKEDEEEKIKRGPRAGTINWLQQCAVLIDLINTVGRKLGKSLGLSLSS